MGQWAKAVALHSFASMLVPVSVAALLGFTASLKSYELASNAVQVQGVLSTRPFLTGLILYEIALGLWLISGLHAPVARIVTGLTFIAFFEVSLYQALVGEGSCGCLGRVTVSPWIMAGVDLAPHCRRGGGLVR
jgi:hypothetical protein